MTADPTISTEHQQDEALVNENPALNPTVGATRLSGLNADREVESPEDATAGSKFVEQDFYNPFDGTKGRPGGIYLDVVERERAETSRAKSEGRDPDYENPPAVAGTPLVVDSMRVDNSLYSNPGSDPVAPVKEVDPVSTAPIDVGIATGEVNTDTLEQHLAEAEARNESVNNEPTGNTAETGAQPVNPEAVESTANVQTETTPEGNSYQI